MCSFPNYQIRFKCRLRGVHILDRVLSCFFISCWLESGDKCHSSVSSNCALSNRCCSSRKQCETMLPNLCLCTHANRSIHFCRDRRLSCAWHAILCGLVALLSRHPCWNIRAFTNSRQQPMQTSWRTTMKWDHTDSKYINFVSVAVRCFFRWLCAVHIFDHLCWKCNLIHLFNANCYARRSNLHVLLFLPVSWFA